MRRIGGENQREEKKKMFCLFNFVCVSLEAFIAVITRKLITLEWLCVEMNARKTRTNKTKEKNRKKINTRLASDPYSCRQKCSLWHFEFNLSFEAELFFFSLPSFWFSVFHSLQMVIILAIAYSYIIVSSTFISILFG